MGHYWCWFVQRTKMGQNAQGRCSSGTIYVRKNVCGGENNSRTNGSIHTIREFQHTRQTGCLFKEFKFYWIIRPGIVTLNSETIVLTSDRTDFNAPKTTVLFFPPTPKFLRGLDHDVVWIEEPHMNEEATRECILLSLEMSHFKMVLTSVSAESLISTMRDQMTSPLETEFINVASVCDECRVGGYSEECHHNDRFRPMRLFMPALQIQTKMLERLCHLYKNNT